MRLSTKRKPYYKLEPDHFFKHVFIFKQISQLDKKQILAGFQRIYLNKFLSIILAGTLGAAGGVIGVQIAKWVSVGFNF